MRWLITIVLLSVGLFCLSVGYFDIKHFSQFLHIYVWLLIGVVTFAAGILSVVFNIANHMKKLEKQRSMNE